MTIIGTWRRDRSLVKVVKNFISPVFLVPLFLALASSEFVWSANPSTEIRVVYSCFSGSSVPVWIAQERDLLLNKASRLTLSLRPADGLLRLLLPVRSSLSLLQRPRVFRLQW